MKLVALAALLASSLLFQASGRLPGSSPGSAEAEPVSSLIELGEGALGYLPASVGQEPAPVLVLLHGAGGRADGMIARFRDTADAHGLVLLAPQSTGRTWDMILAATARRSGRTFSFAGGDAARVERALDRLGERAGLDSDRVTLAGFSDGASYALSLGPVRPGLYRALIAFSPGFVVRGNSTTGRQRVFVAHGRRDSVLPFARSRDVVVPQLRSAGHDVTFQAFDGGHLIPDQAVEQASNFLRR